MSSSEVDNNLSSTILTSPWKSAYNNGVSSPSNHGDQNTYTTISPRYDIMSTIPEECSPLFNKPVDSFQEKKESVEGPRSIDMVGSIFDYIENNEEVNNELTCAQKNAESNYDQKGAVKKPKKPVVNARSICKSFSTPDNIKKRSDSVNEKTTSQKSKADSEYKSDVNSCRCNVNVQYRKKWTSFTV